MTGRAWHLPTVVTLDDLGPLEKTISDGAGQSTGIHPVTEHPGWLAKLYRTPGGHGDATRLDGLIALAGTVTGEDATTLRASTSWPVARIAERESQALGCVIPAAPDKFRWDGAGAAPRFREVDWLAKPDDAFARRNYPVPSRSDRLRVCRNLVVVAAVLERHKLVYSDWSYSNAFWCDTDASVFVIDIDGCGPNAVPNIFQPNWDDPLTQRPNEADGYTDRYRVALLVTRCLTGQRDLASALNALAESDGLGNRGLREILLDILLSEEREQRPSMAELATVIAGGLYVRFGPRPTRSAVPARPVPTLPKAGAGGSNGAAGAGQNVKWPGPPEESTAPSTSGGGQDAPGWRAAAMAIFFFVLLIAVLLLALFDH
jgi:hypothetical protein